MTEDFLPFALPLIEDEEVQAVTEALRSGWITTGPRTKEFERAFAEFVGARHAVALNSCTAALHLALDAVGSAGGRKQGLAPIDSNSEVITTPFSFAATAEVVRYFGAKPVFVDIDRETLNIDPAQIEKALTPRTRAIIPVHYAGLPCDMDAILDIARSRNIAVIEDAAHALPATFRGTSVGALRSDVTCFSFYATKSITTGEGGMFVTDSDQYAERARVMSLHGISKDAWKRYTKSGSWRYEIVAPGYKYNMTDIAAAMGLAQLKKADAMRRRRQEIAETYDRAFLDVSGLALPPRAIEQGTVHSHHLYVLRFDPDMFTKDRDFFIDELNKRGIGTSVHFIPLHIHPYYRDTYGYKPEDFPVTYEIYKKVLSLPIYPKMSDNDVMRVINAVTDITDRFKR